MVIRGLAAACALGACGCSLIVSGDPPPGSEIRLSPSVVLEGSGSGDSARRFPLSIQAPDSLTFSNSITVEVAFGDGERARCCVDCGPSCDSVARSADGRWLAIGVGVPVLADETPHSIAVFVSDPPLEFESQIEITHLPTLELSEEGPFDSDTLEPIYASISVTANTLFDGTETVRLTAAGPINFDAPVQANANNGIPGPGGLRGGFLGTAGDPAVGGGILGTDGGHGGGGGYATAGEAGSPASGCYAGNPGAASATRTSVLETVPLRGGSGGASGHQRGIAGLRGAGGAGGGAILVSSDSVIIASPLTAFIANGGPGQPGDAIGNPPECTGSGGGGSGGAIVLQAPAILGGSTVVAAGGLGGPGADTPTPLGGAGGAGFGRIDSPNGTVNFAINTSEFPGLYWQDAPLAAELIDGRVELSFVSEADAEFELEVDDTLRSEVEVVGQPEGTIVPISVGPGFHTACLRLVVLEPAPSLEREQRFCTRFVALP